MSHVSLIASNISSLSSVPSLSSVSVIKEVGSVISTLNLHANNLSNLTIFNAAIISSHNDDNDSGAAVRSTSVTQTTGNSSVVLRNLRELNLSSNNLHQATTSTSHQAASTPVASTLPASTLPASTTSAAHPVSLLECVPNLTKLDLSANMLQGLEGVFKTSNGGESVSQVRLSSVSQVCLKCVSKCVSHSLAQSPAKKTWQPI